MPYRALKYGMSYAAIGTIICVSLFGVALMGQTDATTKVATDTFLGLTAKEGLFASLATLSIVFCMWQLNKVQGWLRTEHISAMDRNTAAMNKAAAASEAVKDAIRDAPCGRKIDSDVLTGTSAVERVERRVQRTQKEQQ